MIDFAPDLHGGFTEKHAVASRATAACLSAPELLVRALRDMLLLAAAHTRSTMRGAEGSPDSSGFDGRSRCCRRDASGLVRARRAEI
jgi:hypothetical protein